MGIIQKSTKVTSKQARVAYCAKVYFRSFLHEINRKFNITVYFKFFQVTVLVPCGIQKCII